MLPIIYQSHDLIIYSYPLLMGLGWGTAYQILSEIIPPNYSRVHFQFIFWGIFLSSWLAAKTLFLITLPANLSEEVFGKLSFWMGGGFVFYGGLLGGMVFIVFFHKYIKKVSYELLWAILPALTIGHGVGRIGCFLTGCCFGDVTTLPWGIYQHGHFRHPTQLLEAIFLIGLGIYLLKSKREKYVLFIYYLLGYGSFRFFLEFLRGDTIRGSWLGLSPSQIISLGLISLGLISLRKPLISST